MKRIIGHILARLHQNDPARLEVILRDIPRDWEYFNALPVDEAVTAWTKPKYITDYDRDRRQHSKIVTIPNTQAYMHFIIWEYKGADSIFNDGAAS